MPEDKAATGMQQGQDKGQASVLQVAHSTTQVIVERGDADTWSQELTIVESIRHVLNR